MVPVSKKAPRPPKQPNANPEEAMKQLCPAARYALTRKSRKKWGLHAAAPKAAARGLPEAAAASVLPEAAPEAAASGSGPHEAAKGSAGAVHGAKMMPTTWKEWNAIRDSMDSKTRSRFDKVVRILNEIGKPPGKAEILRRSRVPNLDQLPSWDIPKNEMLFDDGWRTRYDVSGLPMLLPGHKLYFTRDFYILNADGLRTDERGRHWRPRGRVGSTHSRGKGRPHPHKGKKASSNKRPPAPLPVGPQQPVDEASKVMPSSAGGRSFDGASKEFTDRSFDGAGAALPRRPQCSTGPASQAMPKTQSFKPNHVPRSHGDHSATGQWQESKWEESKWEGCPDASMRQWKESKWDDASMPRCVNGSLLRQWQESKYKYDERNHYSHDWGWNYECQQQEAEPDLQERAKDPRPFTPSPESDSSYEAWDASESLTKQVSEEGRNDQAWDSGASKTPKPPPPPRRQKAPKESRKNSNGMDKQVIRWKWTVVPDPPRKLPNDDRTSYLSRDELWGLLDDKDKDKGCAKPQDGDPRPPLPRKLAEEKERPPLPRKLAAGEKERPPLLRKLAADEKERPPLPRKVSRLLPRKVEAD